MSLHTQSTHTHTYTHTRTKMCIHRHTHPTYLWSRLHYRWVDKKSLLLTLRVASPVPNTVGAILDLLHNSVLMVVHSLPHGVSLLHHTTTRKVQGDLSDKTMLSP